MGRMLLSIVVFIASLVAMAAICTVTWDSYLNGKVYDCTDGGSLDFWFPGHWVHHPVTVTHVAHGRSMSEPDMIKLGWSMRRLWFVWCSFVGISLAVSFGLAQLPWLWRS